MLTPLRGGRQKNFILVGGDFDFRLPLCMGFVGLGSQAKFPKHVAQKYFSPLSASLEILRPSGRMNFFLGRDGLIISGGQGTSKHRRAYCPELHFACPTGGIGKANGGVKTLLLILNQSTQPSGCETSICTRLLALQPRRRWRLCWREFEPGTGHRRSCD